MFVSHIDDIEKKELQGDAIKGVTKQVLMAFRCFEWVAS